MCVRCVACSFMIHLIVHYDRTFRTDADDSGVVMCTYRWYIEITDRFIRAPIA